MAGTFDDIIKQVMDMKQYVPFINPPVGQTFDVQHQPNILGPEYDNLPARYNEDTLKSWNLGESIARK